MRVDELDAQSYVDALAETGWFEPMPAAMRERQQLGVFAAVLRGDPPSSGLASVRFDPECSFGSGRFADLLATRFSAGCFGLFQPTNIVEIDRAGGVEIAFEHAGQRYVVTFEEWPRYTPRAFYDLVDRAIWQSTGTFRLVHIPPSAPSSIAFAIAVPAAARRARELGLLAAEDVLA